jgi:hypothetical protein
MMLLAVMTLLAVLLLVGTLWVGLVRIYNILEDIGGAKTSTPASLLAQVRWGVRAIETHCETIEPQARRLAGTLASIDEALAQLEGNAAQRGGAER